MKIRSYNAERALLYSKKKSWTDRLILMRSPVWVHTEIQFSELYGEESFSFTLKDDAKGGRFKQIDYTKHPERWDTFELHPTPKAEERMHKKAMSLVGVGYDLVGLLSHATKLEIIRPHNEKNWCTEGVCIVGCEWPEFNNWLMIHIGKTEITPFHLQTELMNSWS